jgi:hypothetical protein
LLLEQIIDAIRKLIESKDFLERARRKDSDFTRNRKMSFTAMMVFMINLVRTSTQTALDRFWNMIGKPEQHMTQQSFSEARQKLRPEACIELHRLTVSQVYAHDVNRWHGMAVVAIDGSKIQLPDDKQLLEIFGGTGRGAVSPTAQASSAYDILNNIIVDAQIEPLSVCENTLAVKHMECISEIPGLERTLIILDRGYSSADLMAQAESKGLKFLVRLRKKFNVEIDGLSCGIHDFELPVEDAKLAVKVIKFVLPGGEVETLVTNLSDARMGIKAFKELYFLRWQIETKYGEVKLKIEIENFSGRTEIAIRQDFYITVMLSNVISIASREAQPVVDLARAGKKNKYRYKVNVNQAVGTLKDRFIQALLEADTQARGEKTEEIIRLLCEHVVPERKGRSVFRNPSPRKARFHHNMKSNC